MRQDARASVRLLLSAGADPGVAAPNGQTALRVAIANRHYTVAGLLLAAGADPTVRDGRGNTALHELVTSRSPPATSATSSWRSTARTRPSCRASS